MALQLTGKGFLALFSGDVSDGRRLLRESLALAHEYKAVDTVPDTIDGLAATAAVDGDFADAARMSGATEALSVRIGNVRYFRQTVADRYLLPARATYGEEEWGCAFREGQALSEEEMLAHALASTTDRQPTSSN
jgi:hypothetical protein